MIEKYIITEYFQKSKNLLFPLLGFKKEEKFIPKNTYLYWNNYWSIDNFDLIVHYDKMGYGYERSKILRNPHHKACYELDEGFFYIFDLSEYNKDVCLFMKGKYSKMSSGAQYKIRDYHNDYYKKVIPLKEHFCHMIFNPIFYYREVLKELGSSIKIEDLKQVGELWDVYNKEKETINIILK